MFIHLLACLIKDGISDNVVSRNREKCSYFAGTDQKGMFPSEICTVLRYEFESI